ncbi:sugar porter family MFS transporter [Deinococcus sp. SDU3-2]|uniref:Sugar porter family MFS transporter n=1 Tax=Deinococcus terrestris TaxID=2651870 RepID=A0A7X1NW38_9DEIO|nr:sugar porter family MFS transporter [Deinococcus terrestris]MPY66516.1 sugar porter family MFS transporter [Deinococcus terrestris]
MADSKYRSATLIAAGAAVGGLLAGGDTSTLNGGIVGIRTTLELESGSVGFVTAISLLGAAAGAWFAGPLASRYGRGRIMLGAGILIGLGWLGVTLAGGVLPLVLARVVVGLGLGAASAVVPGYISEVAPTAIRGRLGTFWQISIVLGQLIALIVSYLLTLWAGSEAAPLFFGAAAWRWMFGVAVLAALAYIVITLRLPRTPPELVREGDVQGAQEVLTRLGGGEGASRERLAEIQQGQADAGGERSLAALRGPALGLRPIVWTGIGLAAFQQLVGIQIVKVYSNTLWQAVGFSTDQAFLTSILTVGLSVVAALIAIGIIDRVGRRTMLGVGGVFLVITLGTLAVVFGNAGDGAEGPVLTQGSAIIALSAVGVYSLAFGITWGPVMWVMLNELFASNLRTTAVAVCTAVNWIMNWAVVRTFPSLADLGLGLAYGVYTVFAVLALLFVWRTLPETRDRSLA